MADYDDGCRVKSISTKCPTKKSRTSSSLPISRRENASVSRRHSRRYSKSLAKTCKSGSHRPVAPRSRIHALKLILEYNRIWKWNTEEGRRLPNEPGGKVPGDQIVFVEDPGG